MADIHNLNGERVNRYGEYEGHSVPDFLRLLADEIESMDEADAPSKAVVTFLNAKTSGEYRGIMRRINMNLPEVIGLIEFVKSDFMRDD